VAKVEVDSRGTRARWGSGNSGEHGCGFGRSQLYSDEAPPIGSIGIESWTGVAFPVIVLLLRWN
jgi:hypothetical protein